MTMRVSETPEAVFVDAVIRPEDGSDQCFVLAYEVGMVVGVGEVSIPVFNKDVAVIVDEKRHARIAEHVDIEELFRHFAATHHQKHAFQLFVVEHRHGIGDTRLLGRLPHDDALFRGRTFDELPFSAREGGEVILGYAAFVLQQARFRIVPELLILGDDPVYLFVRHALGELVADVFRYFAENLAYGSDAVADNCGGKPGSLGGIIVRSADYGGVQVEGHDEGRHLQDEDDGYDDITEEL